MRVGILGATGAVGQHLVALLQDHPLFTITALAASDRSVGKSYNQVWRILHALKESVGEMTICACVPDLPCDLIFSCLDSSVAGEIEAAFATAGYPVISNSKNHRMDPLVPLLVPEVNGEQMRLIEKQPYGAGCIITNPNCVVAGLAVALKPLVDAFGIQTVSVMTMQAISGAGFYGLAPEAIEDNVIPFIKDEEEKIETELQKILGPMTISAHCNRVPVSNGHTACVSVTFKEQASAESIKEAWNSFGSLVVLEEAPEPKKHLRPMDVVVGRLRPCPLGGWKFVVLSNNMMRGAAGAALLNAELYSELHQIRI